MAEVKKSGAAKKAAPVKKEPVDPCVACRFTKGSTVCKTCVNFKE